MGQKSRNKYMYFDKRFRSSTSRTATNLKFDMSRLFRKRRKDKQQQRQILRKIDVNVNIYSGASAREARQRSTMGKKNW